MADNIQLNAGTGGSVLATDDVGGVQYQRVKPAYGADGAATDVSLTSPLPTQSPSQLQTITVTAGSGVRNFGPVDLTGAAHFTVATAAIGSGIAFSLQFSNDQVTWVTTQVEVFNNTGISQANLGTSSVSSFLGTVGSYLISAPNLFRYMRVTTTAAATTGTYVFNVVTYGYPVRMSPSLAQTVAGANVATLDAATLTNVVNANAASYAYNGASWDRLRTPKVFKTVSLSASGSTYVWTPTASLKFRLMGYKLSVAGNASLGGGGGELVMTFYDLGTAMPLVESCYVASTPSNTLAGWSSGWVDLGNGILSAGGGNNLQLNLSVALATGSVRVIVAGTEE